MGPVMSILEIERHRLAAAQREDLNLNQSLPFWKRASLLQDKHMKLKNLLHKKQNQMSKELQLKIINKDLLMN